MHDPVVKLFFGCTLLMAAVTLGELLAMHLGNVAGPALGTMGFAMLTAMGIAKFPKTSP